MFFDLPPNDSADYGWGKGRYRVDLALAPSRRALFT